jgi:hypothetical protein
VALGGREELGMTFESRAIFLNVAVSLLPAQFLTNSSCFVAILMHTFVMSERQRE